jgi:branched-chain amino acid transport system substrate-binding protein
VSQLDRRQALRLFAAVGAAGAAAPILSACAEQGADSTVNERALPRGGAPVKIGMIVPQSGAFKPLGDDMANGFQLYLRLSGNTFAGRQVELVSVDEGETADSGKAAVDKLVKQEKVLAISGVVNPQVILAIKDMVEAAQVPLIGSNASPGALQGAKYIWRTSFVASEPSTALAHWVAEHTSGTVAVVAGDYPGDKEEVKAFISAFKDARGTSSTPVYTPLQMKDFTSVLQAVKASTANAMFCYYTGQSAVDFVKSVKQVNFPANFQIFAPGALTEGFAVKAEGDAAKGILTSLNYSPDLNNGANRRFVAEYQKLYNTVPSTYAMASYDAAAVLDEAIAEAGADLNPVSLNAAVGRLGQIDSPRGPWQFTQNRTPLQKWYLREVRPDGGVYSNVLTAELTTMGGPLG